MSLCMAFIDQGKILVCADSRVSAEVDGKKYFVTDQYKKIRQVGDKVIFISGEVDILEKIFNAINEYSTIRMIQRKVKKFYDEFILKHRDDPLYKNTQFGIEIGVYIFTIENGKPVIYQMIYKNDFEVDRQEPGNKELFGVAAYSDKAVPYAQKLTAKMPLEKALMNTYRHFANEIVGGYLHWFLIDINGISSKIEPIKDNKSLSKWQGRPFPYHADMHGNTVLNKLTANTATISNSVFNNGAITGSSINVNDRFIVDSSGNMTARSGNFSGSISGSTITGGIITGSTLRTASSGRRIEIDSIGFRTYDNSNRNRISINTGSDSGIAAISFYGSSGGFAGEINSYSSSGELTVYSDNSIYIGGNRVPRINLNGDVDASSLSVRYLSSFNGRVYFNGGVSGIGVGDISGLQSELNSLRSQIEALKRDKVDKGSYTSTAGSFNGGIPIGTALRTASGGTVTWAGIAAHDHRV
ncbi:hypothetical protein [Paenibacillus sp. MSJ-34]|uniref:hypothetical protein n=1 Tax=Paenibacillus sp. MSJ-34 TaxID=2841529 RepID=UPI001C1296EA|nr:hypothetical protein [Paenibacillus sp. MSJ-34]MBU5445677.1 hypothetical protein [Paenibacillus sp. MSJ-34]